MTCFLMRDNRYPGDSSSNSIPDRVDSVHENWTETGVGFEGPFTTSNLALRDPRPESSDVREMTGKDHDACRVNGFLQVHQSIDCTCLENYSPDWLWLSMYIANIAINRDRKGDISERFHSRQSRRIVLVINFETRAAWLALPVRDDLEWAAVSSG